MMPTDWAALWRELATSDIQASAEGEVQMIERWRRVARRLDSGEKQEPSWTARNDSPAFESRRVRIQPFTVAVEPTAGLPAKMSTTRSAFGIGFSLRARTSERAVVLPQDAACGASRAGRDGRLSPFGIERGSGPRISAQHSISGCWGLEERLRYN